MRPNVSREAKQGWIVLGGAVTLALLVAWFVFDDGGLSDQLSAEQAKLPRGNVRLSEQVKRSREATEHLRQTIGELKQQVGFTLEKAFQVKDDQRFTQQPGYYFNTMRAKVIERLQELAGPRRRGIGEYEEYIGFGPGNHQPPPKDPPPDDQAIDLLRALQITDKLVSTCLNTPTPLQKLVVHPHGTVKPEPVVPPGRPTLCKEYRVSVDLRGSLTDILWILHRLSPGRDAPGEDYPLILKSLTITSLNISPVQSIPQLDVNLTVAGMRFLNDEEREGEASASRLPGLRRSAPESDTKSDDVGNGEQMRSF
jgi:hypothetical protein